jgi:hypothetical protein
VVPGGQYVERIMERDAAGRRALPHRLADEQATPQSVPHDD